MQKRERVPARCLPKKPLPPISGTTNTTSAGQLHTLERINHCCYVHCFRSSRERERARAGAFLPAPSSAALCGAGFEEKVVSRFAAGSATVSVPFPKGEKEFNHRQLFRVRIGTKCVLNGITSGVQHGSVVPRRCKTQKRERKQERECCHTITKVRITNKKSKTHTYTQKISCLFRCIMICLL